MKTTLSLLIIALTASSALTASYKQSISYKLCPEVKTQNIAFDEIDVSPWPLKKGVKADFEISGVPSVAINQKYIQLKVYEKGTAIYTTHIGGPNTTPAGGNYDYQLAYGLPSIVPRGTYDLHFSMISTSGDTYGCFAFTVTF